MDNKELGGQSDNMPLLDWARYQMNKMNNSVIYRLEEIYTKAMFTPSFLSVLINPLYFIRKGLYRGVVSKKSYLKGRLLDFGCGSKPYREIIDVQEYIGLDVKESGHSHQNEQIDVYYDGETIPFDNGYFDSIFSSEVFEHISNLEHILNELYRVIKPGGYMLITLPFV
jgi:SAM-dependent methyltransferase